MTRLSTLCAVSLSLALPAPLVAQSFGDEPIGIAPFAALADVDASRTFPGVGDLGPGAQRAEYHVAPPPVFPEPPVVERGGLGAVGAAPPVVQREPPRGAGLGDPSYFDVPWDRDRGTTRSPVDHGWRSVTLPSACLIAQDQFSHACLVNRMPVGAVLPSHCFARRLIDDRVRETYDGACMRAVGYRTP